MPITNALRCALYIRVSSPHRPGAGSDDSAERQHTDNQRVQLLEFVQSAGWTIAREYEDRDTGGKSDRAQFQRLMDDAAKRRFDVVLFWSLDRFSREGVYETLHHLRYLDSHGVAFRSYTEQYLDSCGIFKDAVLAILAVIAKQERVRMSERIRAGIDYARSQGKRMGPRPKAINLEILRMAIDAGKTGHEIAAMLGCSRSTVYERIAALARRDANAGADASADADVSANAGADASADADVSADASADREPLQ